VAPQALGILVKQLLHPPGLGILLEQLVLLPGLSQALTLPLQRTTLAEVYLCGRGKSLQSALDQ